jgi:hypothetical protein
MSKSKSVRQGSATRTQKSIYGNPKMAPERTALSGIKVSRKPDVIGARQK